MKIYILLFLLFGCIISTPVDIQTNIFNGIYITEEFSKPLKKYTFRSDDVKIFMITRTNPTMTQVDITNINEISTLGFDVSKDTAFIVHGWHNNHASPFCEIVSTNIITVRDTNVFIVDWFSITQHLYSVAAAAVPDIGEILTRLIEYLVDNSSLDLKKVSIVGHSLGAHVAGVAGMNLNGQLDHIVGLDPALPLFPYEETANRLDHTDAKFVQVIHTCPGILGYNINIGHSDYYPNGNRFQPGCGPDIIGDCAHGRSFIYYAESLLSGGFIAEKCDSYESFQNNQCSGNKSYMGEYDIDKTASGTYYLNTHSDPPYAKH